MVNPIWSGWVSAFLNHFHNYIELWSFPKGCKMLVLQAVSEADGLRWAGVHTMTASWPLPASPGAVWTVG